ncbi:MAG: NAD-binding protein [Candidatus Hodarchaeota archaeon]
MINRIENLWIDFLLRIRRSKLFLLICAIFWVISFIVFYVLEGVDDLGHVLLVSLGVRDALNPSDYSGFYELFWPVLVEVIVFGFIFGALLEKFNPPLTCKLLAQHQRNHTVVIGYHHFGRRIVDYLRENKERYVVIEEEEENIDDLIEAGEPVVAGDPTEMINLKYAAIERCKEVFLVSNEIRDAIVVSEKIRDINKDCKLYVRIFADYFQNYLARDPINATCFSTTKWYMESIKEWTQGKSGAVIVIGHDHLAELIAEHIGNEQKREVLLIDPSIEAEDLEIQGNGIKIVKDEANRIPSLEQHIDLKNVKQVFLCWKEEEEFSDSMYLVSRFHQEYPEIELYLRIFDDELGSIIENSDNTWSFSTSIHAFNKLRENVDRNSSLAL